ncbi:MAG TPA: lysophospholipid acyltransferase family protein [Thermoanaerobaculia bacterium]|nr:lysophospholipid acyltransferase family protein [Thermoanaerobaculia bacterium]
MTRFLRRFLVRGVFWRQFLHWAVLNIPFWMEPMVMCWWSMFFLFWGPGRRGVMRNLTAIFPGSTAPANFFRTYRVFWNYAWTITDNARFRLLRTIPRWDFEHRENFEALQSHSGGAILLTAHMGSYDLGAALFAELTTRRIVMVRAPELDPETREYEERVHEEKGANGLRVGFNTTATDLAFDLLAAVQSGEIVAIQGDRVTPGVASVETTLFGKRTNVPAGPFALAMASRAPIFPLFVMRRGRRHYCLLTCEPIMVTRTSRDRDHDIRRGVDEWVRALESAIRNGWQQWFAFEPFSEELAA